MGFKTHVSGRQSRVSERFETPRRGQVLRAAYLQRVSRVLNDDVLNGPHDEDGGMPSFGDDNRTIIVDGGDLKLVEQAKEAKFDIIKVPIVEADDEEEDGEEAEGEEEDEGPYVKVRRQTLIVLLEEGTGRRFTCQLVPPKDKTAKVPPQDPNPTPDPE